LEVDMGFSYNKLWKLLIDKNMKKKTYNVRSQQLPRQ